MDLETPDIEEASGTFAETHWSIIAKAGGNDPVRAQAALEALCRNYWQPVYSFVRRQGYNPHDSEDLTQDFFARLLTKNYLGTVSPEKGRFRSFLLACVKHFLANEYDKGRAQKRGGGLMPIPFDTQLAESLCTTSDESAETIFQRHWALAVLNQSLARLRPEYELSGNTQLFESLKSALSGEDGPPAYATIARSLHMSTTAVKVAVHRLRKRYRSALRDEIAKTVADPGEIDQEIQSLFTALGN